MPAHKGDLSWQSSLTSFLQVSPPSSTTLFAMPAAGLTVHPPEAAHLAWWEGPDNHNLDAWESEEAFAAFVPDRLGPAMAQAGVNVEPTVTFHPAHEVFLPNALIVK